MAAVSSSSSSSSASASSFLVTVLDLNPIPWRSQSTASILSTLVPPTLIFLNAHLALSHSNGVAVYACSTRGKARLLYSTAAHASKRARQDDDSDDEDDSDGEQAGSSSSLRDASTYQHFALLGRAVVKGIKRMVKEMQREQEQYERDRRRREGEQNGNGAAEDEEDEDEDEEETALVKVLSMSLSHLNRIALDNPGVPTNTSSTDPLPASKGTLVSSGAGGSSGDSSTSSTSSRILVLSSTRSASNQYVGLMNCIFAAQRRGIPIDVLKLQGGDTVFLQQATNLTGGIYFRVSSPPDQEGEDDDGAEAAASSPATALTQRRLLQILLSTYLPPPRLRNRCLHLPTLDDVDFRASCFCHGAIVDEGYVCGVCLSIFCHPPSRCLICSSPFPRKTLQKFREDRTVPQLGGGEQEGDGQDEDAQEENGAMET